MLLLSIIRRIAAYKHRRVFNIRYTKTGGMHFLRIGCMCFCFCLTSKPFIGKRYDYDFNAHLDDWRWYEEANYWEEQTSHGWYDAHCIDHCLHSIQTYDTELEQLYQSNVYYHHND